MISMFFSPAAQAAACPRVGVAVAEDEVAVRFESVAHLPAHDDAAEGLIARGDALCERGEVRRDTVVLCSEPRSEPAEPGDHLIEDQKGAVLVA